MPMVGAKMWTFSIFTIKENRLNLVENKFQVTSDRFMWFKCKDVIRLNCQEKKSKTNHKRNSIEITKISLTFRIYLSFVSFLFSLIYVKYCSGQWPRFFSFHFITYCWSLSACVKHQLFRIAWNFCFIIFIKIFFYSFYFSLSFKYSTFFILDHALFGFRYADCVYEYRTSNTLDFYHEMDYYRKQKQQQITTV